MEAAVEIIIAAAFVEIVAAIEDYYFGRAVELAVEDVEDDRPRLLPRFGNPLDFDDYSSCG